MNEYDLLKGIGTNLGRPLTQQETEQAQLWLGWAKNQIRARLGDLDQLDQDTLAMVLIEAITLRLKRPDQSRQEQHTVAVDDGSVTRSSTFDNASGQLTILPEWWVWLTPAGHGSEAFTITPSYAPGCSW
ncbi:hypothetical protein [Luteipulveratus halotolerans]|uniref:Uncharacterized protein n=1 Tax=Luteipulveratus halotolerans TaxID=1631356 RepID=A0A0L6CJY5_9MICO|nr:hypothetical protein [Luteipulveratus halotolerans]KNX38097.1 hypothetical protein VV01_14635 [Luteipulveratus halotolerans]